jgi:hypothetical protein
MTSPALARVVAEHNPHGRWTPEKKFEAVESWLLYGNLRLTSATLGIGYSTLKAWKNAEWWRDLEREIQAGARIKQMGSISKIVDRGLEVISDRLENGEVVLDQKSGALVRRPVALRDAGGVVSNLMQRQSILEKQASDEFSSESNKTIQEQLQLLANEFAKFNNRSKAQAIDIDFKEIPNALHDEREAGLQEGSGEIYVEAGGSEEEDGAEPSPSDDGEEGFSPQRGW